MRKDTVEAELADDGDANYETIEDIEFRDKREKMELREKEKKDKMREDRLKRMQAFQASSVLREEPEENMDEDEEMEDEDELIEEKEPEENPFYSSYNEAVENKEDIEDPLKEERERTRLKLEEDEQELKKLEQERQLRKLKESQSPEPPQSKKQKTDFEKYSGVGVFKAMIDSEKEKIQKEITEGEARAIKALLMKAGKEEGEAETLAIEEALDEQKKKEKDGPKEEVKKDRHLRKRDNEEEVAESNESIAKKKKEESEDEEVPEKVYSSENKAMNKAREALILSENRKIIQDEVKQRKEEEAKFMYEEQLRKEKMENENTKKLGRKYN
eukprot:TRINITY_DN2990_c0_g2_i3.p1 TRINITY_DN2990_c0_g2~~TRINITY_DN2990_c0_g2_i3.p1  ORF type:complete len:330 (+),score=144.64 TRINITY_DN2990_c0_g2_i3:537-1526(+)